MPEKNYRTEAEVTDISSNGSGVAKKDGYPLFIKDAVTGDVLDITVTKTNKNYGFAEINKIITPSPYRTKPVCKCFKECGGCDFMHIDYSFQLEIKKKFVTENIRKIGGISQNEYVFEGIEGAQNTLFYRNKAQFPVGIKSKKAICGFYSKKSHDIIACEKCLIQNDSINEAAAKILEYINENRISVYNEQNHTGEIRHIYIRTGGCSNELMAVIVTNSEKPLKNENALIEKLRKIQGLKSIIQNINTKKTNIILGDKNRVIYGRNYIISQIKNLKFKISPQSFFQVNCEQTEKLYGKALEYAGLNGSETVFDLYCGTGSISLFLAQGAKKVIGVEIVPEAIKNAKENAELNKIRNADFYAGDCAEVVERLIKNGERADVAVLDPPRKGCSEELLSLVYKMNPERIVYVSCNSATLARDIAVLKNYGYTLKRLCAVDMFPMSVHVESVSLIVKE